MELGRLISWAEAMVHYMQIAIQMGKPSMAEVAIDSEDVEYMKAILSVLKEEE